jgi:divalent metal cation (Fe/Co/Zn/Cd) transporter
MRLVRRSFDGLMDHALPQADLAQVRAAIDGALGPEGKYHALRTRQAGARRFVDFHLLVPGRMTVRESHKLSGEIEAAVQRLWSGVEVVIHVEPIEEPASYQDSEMLAVEAEQATNGGKTKGAV